MRVRRQSGLHPDLDRFEGTEENVGNELGGCGGAEVDDGLGRIREHLLAVLVFEQFVGAVLASALEAVADESGRPAEEDAAEALRAEDGGPGLQVGLVDLGVDLAAAFYEIERCDGGVGWAAGWDGVVSNG